MSDFDTSSESSAQFQVECSSVCDVVRKPKRRRHKSRPWHRLLGLISALPLIWVLLTGLMLNHSEDFRLDSIELNSPMILSCYGMTPSGEPMSVSVHDHTITSWDGIVFFDQRHLDVEGKFLTALQLNNCIVVVSDQVILRLSLDGEVIEKLDELSLPEIPLIEAGVVNGKMAIRSADGWSIADSDWLEFSETNETIKAVTLHTLQDDTLRGALRTQWAGGGISMSRFVLDLHAGNFLGSLAAYFYDFVVLCTLWLIGTGLVLQIRTSRRNRANS